MPSSSFPGSDRTTHTSEFIEYRHARHFEDRRRPHPPQRLAGLAKTGTHSHSPTSQVVVRLGEQQERSTKRNGCSTSAHALALRFLLFLMTASLKSLSSSRHLAGRMTTHQRTPALTSGDACKRPNTLLSFRAEQQIVAFSDLGDMSQDAAYRIQQPRVGSKVEEMPGMQTSTVRSKTGIGASVHILLHE